MKFTGIIFCIAIFSLSAYPQAYPCLPSNINEDTIVRVIREQKANRTETVKKITARTVLKNLRARCFRGQLIDRKRKGIKFFSLAGCWGNPPADYLEIQEQQARELAELKKKYSVIEISCDAGDTPRYLIP